MRELSKAFEHSEVDPRWYAFWESIGAFRANPASGKPRFSMVIPPPNVTGSLHMGHALNHTMPDIIARWKRMQGYDVLWLPGTDHAGIATQNVVEKQLAQEGKSRHDLGREAFEARVWDWVKQSHGTITGQMRKLGESVDWTRERFTLDEQLSRAVRRVFVTLYEEGLIYRGTYIVNWCPRCRTALSDLEVVHKDTTGSSGTCAIRAADGGQVVVVATTRPGDDAGRHGDGGQPRRRAVPGPDRPDGSAADYRARADHRRRRVRRPGVRHRRRESDARARSERLPDGEASQPARGGGHRRGRADHGSRRAVRRARSVQGAGRRRRAARGARGCSRRWRTTSTRSAPASAAARWSSRSCRRSGS